MWSCLMRCTLVWTPSTCTPRPCFNCKKVLRPYLIPQWSWIWYHLLGDMVSSGDSNWDVTYKTIFLTSLPFLYVGLPLTFYAHTCSLECFRMGQVSIFISLSLKTNMKLFPSLFVWRKLIVTMTKSLGLKVSLVGISS